MRFVLPLITSHLILLHRMTSHHTISYYAVPFDIYIVHVYENQSSIKVVKYQVYVSRPRPSHRLEGAQRRPTRTAQLISSTRFESSRIVYWLTNQARFRYITLHHMTSHYVTSQYVVSNVLQRRPSMSHTTASHLMFPPLHFISLLLFLLNLKVQPKLLQAATSSTTT